MLYEAIRPTLADTAGEHNARVRAMQMDAHRNGTMLDQIDAAFLNLITNAYGDYSTDFAGDDEVTAIQAPLIAAHQSKHRSNWHVAYGATRQAAFRAWDVARARKVAA